MKESQLNRASAQFWPAMTGHFKDYTQSLGYEAIGRGDTTGAKVIITSTSHPTIVDTTQFADFGASEKKFVHNSFERQRADSSLCYRKNRDLPAKKQLPTKTATHSIAAKPLKGYVFLWQTRTRLEQGCATEIESTERTEGQKPDYACDWRLTVGQDYGSKKKKLQDGEETIKISAVIVHLDIALLSEYRDEIPKIKSAESKGEQLFQGD